MIDAAGRRVPSRNLIRFLDRHATWLSLAGSAGLVLALYGRALGFSFLFDDTYDLTRVEGRTYWSLLSSSGGYSYYRPIPFLIWKFLRGLQGHYDPFTLHTLPLAAHALAGWFLYLLLRMLGAGHWALVPAVLFLTYPFHCQVVPIVGTLFHPLAGMAILASLTLYAAGRLRNHRRWNCPFHAVALGATALALWTHESGVAIVPLLIGVELVILARSRSGDRRPSAWLGGHPMLAVAFVAVWSTIESPRAGERLILTGFGPKVQFLLQGFTYPFSAQIDWLSNVVGVSAGVLDVGLFALALIFIAFAIAARRTSRPQLLLIPALGLGLAAAASLPWLASLPWEYVENAPRLLYLPAIGAAIFWGLLPWLSLGSRRATGIWRACTLIALFAVVVQSWQFVGVRMDMDERGSVMIDGVVAVGEAHAGGRLLFANVPSWFALSRYEYPVGHLGVQLIPEYIGLDRVIYTSSAQAVHVDARSVAFEPNTTGGPFGFGPHGPAMPAEQVDLLLREGREAVVVGPVGQDYVVRDVGHLEPGCAAVPTGSPGRLADGVWLSGIQATIERNGSKQVVVAFSWNVLHRLDEDYEAVIELRDEAGSVAVSSADYPLGGLSAPRLWQEGDRVADAIALPVPNVGTYTVWIGLQQRGTGERAPAFDADGQALAGRLVPAGKVVVVEGS